VARAFRCLEGCGCPALNKKNGEISMAKTIDELRRSIYHQQLGRKIYAAFVAQQQGISLNTAFNKVPDSVSDSWLIVAEFARQAAAECFDLGSHRDGLGSARGPVM
jgi:hypothetical protein